MLFSSILRSFPAYHSHAPAPPIRWLNHSGGHGHRGLILKRYRARDILQLELHCSRKQEVQTPEKVLMSETWTDEECDQEAESWLVNEIRRLSEIAEGLAGCASLSMKIKYLKSTEVCDSFLSQHRDAFCVVQERQGDNIMFAILSLIAMGQEHVLGNLQGRDEYLELLNKMGTNLVQLEKFYDSLGGLIGYQLKSLKLIQGGFVDDPCDIGITESHDTGTSYLMPSCLDMSEDTLPDVRNAVMEGILCVPRMAEIYAVGGAGDRLGLVCPETGDPLPSAMLPYCGRTMLDHLMRDLQAREYLHYKITGEQHTTPVAIMTSDAKGNDLRIRNLLESRGWYGRTAESFSVFKQPLVPVVRIPDGKWLVSDVLNIVMKPGGHGVIWKLMADAGVFEWFINNGRVGAIVRQISNPMAGTDTTLLGLSGRGHMTGQAMGFATCERVVGASEGMVVLLHRQVCNETNNGISKRTLHEYGITNIEYTEFERLGICDVPKSKGSNTSCFPANTNILYIGLEDALKAVEKGTREGGGAALPGLIFNMKKKVKYLDIKSGKVVEEHGGRMECMMQNLADSLTTKFDHPISGQNEARLSTFTVSNTRRKVTSSAKKKRKEGSSNIRQTPEGSFLDLMGNAHSILTQCGVDMPKMRSTAEYMTIGPSFIFLFNPCLGPLWSVIAQKIRGGRMAEGSELCLEVADVNCTKLDLKGSLIVHAQSVAGHKTRTSGSNQGNGAGQLLELPSLASDACGSNEVITFSEETGRIHLENVEVVNEGIDWSHPENVYWQHKVVRKGSMQIILRGWSEFAARNITFSGDYMFDVPDGFKMEVREGQNGELIKNLKPLELVEWKWKYHLNREDVVKLSWEEIK